MAVERPDRDALANPPDRWRVTVEDGRVVVDLPTNGLTAAEALRLGHALIGAARGLGAR